MSRIRYERYVPTNDTATAALVACYQAVFAGAPWFETWSEEQVRDDLAHEITPNASCWLAWSGDVLVGFCWGYATSKEALEKKLAVTLPASFPDLLTYQDELGVREEYRGKGIAKQLFRLRHTDFLNQGLEVCVVRTKRSPEPTVTYRWFTEKLQYRLAASYPEDDGRVVLSAEATDVSNSL